MSTLNPQARVLIVDDHPLVREGLCAWIKNQVGLVVSGESDSEDDAFQLVREQRPDLVVVDISLKQGHGLDLIKRIRALDPKIKMLVFSGYQESLYGERCLRAGAYGYLNKQESHHRLLEAIQTILVGKRFFSPALAQKLAILALDSHPCNSTTVEGLSDRELEVFRMIGEGMTSGQIADRLYISTHTIDTHRENIKRKLAVKNSAELSRQAVQWVLENC